MRVIQFLQLILRTRDRAAAGVGLLLVALAAWLALLPLVPAIQRTTLRRFQMQTPRFWQWAVQQPIPAMYNAENRFRIQTKRTAAEHVSNRPMRHLNHFPFRVFTFGDGRFDYLRHASPVSLHIESAYRGHRVATTWEAIPRAEGGHVIRLVEVTDE
jgi:hypothetical protein